MIFSISTFCDIKKHTKFSIRKDVNHNAFEYIGRHQNRFRVKKEHK